MVDEFVSYRLLGVSCSRSKLRHAINHVVYQVEAIEVIQHAHIKRRRSGTLFLVAAYMDVTMTLTPVGQPVNELRVAMEDEDDRFVGGKQRVEFEVREA